MNRENEPARPPTTADAPKTNNVKSASRHAHQKSSPSEQIPSELGQDPIRQLPIRAARPSPENEKLYKPVNRDDPEIVELSLSIREHGVQEPLVVTEDFWILSGHRRHQAALLAGLETIPCRVKPFKRADDPDQFLVLLREFNRQREKSFDEKLREETIAIDPSEAYRILIAHREEQAEIQVEALAMGETRRRAKISPAKKPFMNAVLGVLEKLKKFWPVSDRQIHYPLLNDPPLRHASKPDSTYRNNLSCYKSLVDLLTRARLEGLIPMTAIADETRPVTIWNTWPDVRGFVRSELDGLLKGYWRNLMQSQPNHIEILVEKNTVANIVKPVAGQFCIPMTSGRGFCSLPPRYGMAERFKKSGREKLIVLIASDFDPDGEMIAQSFARSMRDDFGIAQVHAIKVALTDEQVRQFKLPPQMLAKEGSTNYKKFVKRFGRDVYELEAIPPETLQRLVREAIDAVIDRKMYNAELDRLKADAAELEALRRSVVKTIQRRIAA